MKTRNNKSGIYITACALAVIAAVVGFSGRRSQRDEDMGSVTENAQVPPTDSAASEPAQTASEHAQTEEAPAIETESVSKAESIEDIHFTRPVNGRILEEFSDNDLIYNEALKDWRTHNGIDLEAESGTQVVAAASGVVERIFDGSLGKCVEIDHQNGYKTVYANLDESIQLSAGDDVSEGDVIGLVGDTALGDATELPHLHFEIAKNGQNIDPAEYLD